LSFKATEEVKSLLLSESAENPGRPEPQQLKEDHPLPCLEAREGREGELGIKKAEGRG